jgi:hypothetical protein
MGGHSRIGPFDMDIVQLKAAPSGAGPFQMNAADGADVPDRERAEVFGFV